MKATGIVRRIDDLGRVVIPKRYVKRCGSKRGHRWRSIQTGKDRSF